MGRLAGMVASNGSTGERRRLVGGATWEPRLSSWSHDYEEVEYVDVLIVGAGISGIGCAYYLQRDHPERSYAILEARAASGGTWDLFRFPGIRSDSDLHTFGFEFKPWESEHAIASGAEILELHPRGGARERDRQADPPRAARAVGVVVN